MSARVVFAFAVLCLVYAGPAVGYARDQESAANLKANLDLPFDAGGDEEEEEPPPELVLFYGQQYEGDAFFFCCDKSLSMRGKPLERLQSEVIRTVQQFSEGVQFGIVFFDSRVYKFPDSGGPATAKEGTRAASVSWVQSMQIGAASCYKEALIAALTFSQQASAQRKVIILLGDGEPWCPGFDRGQYSADTLSTVHELNVQRARINTICLGAPGKTNENWMRLLASMNNGTYCRLMQ